MNVRRFVERRKARWERFEQLVGIVRWSGTTALGRAELNELGRLYRQVATDLAYARQQGADQKVVDYLNSLLSQAHGVFYRSRRGRLIDGLRTFYYTFPEMVRRHWKVVMLAIGITLMAMLFAGSLVASDPVWTGRLLGAEFKEVLDTWKSGAQRTPGDISMAPGMTTFYFLNNSRVAMLCFGLGVFAGIPTVLILWQNGMMLGIFSAEMASIGKLGYFWVSIYPHGVPELGAVFLCAGGGLLLGKAVIAPGDYTRLEALRRIGGEVFWLLAGSVVLLLIAAFTEAFFSFYAFPSWLKFTWGTTLLFILLAYIVGVRRPESNPNHPA